ncbi:alpha/beta hydrolase [Histidinibacterium aquaticum]|uniref:Cutinase family protein n=1 Tax=Histidinibacterium aquaticum TaxID=2613962 RepID=A0A5J5GBP8_9RHOB|nr:dienelactone hydrolase family protein [Histidinibacterium aquaticum]KAA9005556.1 cutinase family protein [Histidinibacterium aquaticum]
MAGMATAGAEPGAARAVAVLLHGRGQSPDFMREAVVGRLAVDGVHYLMPAAAGSSWYEAKAVDPLNEETETQLRAALAQLEDALEAARTTCPGLPLILVGFSQGACLIIEHLMRGGTADAAAALTGCRVGAASDDLPRADLRDMPVYLTNGDEDPWIPVWAYQKSVGDFVAAGARVRCDILPGRPHEISAVEIAVLDRLIADLAGGTPPLGGAT